MQYPEVPCDASVNILAILEFGEKRGAEAGIFGMKFCFSGILKFAGA